jgi:hypothetical protein
MSSHTNSVALRARLIAGSMLAAAGMWSAGCSGPAAVSRLPEPDLQLLESGTLELASDCRPRAGDVYRAQFDVRADGTVDRIRTTGSEACANDALTRWVASFRYNPRAGSVETVVDWMLVEAPRGG